MSLLNQVATQFGALLEFFTVKKLDDPFILRLRQVNAGMYRAGNDYALEYAIARINDDLSIVEIGSFCGLSTNLISHFMQIHNRTNLFFSCDMWDYSFKNMGDGTIGRSQIKGKEWGDFVGRTFIHNVQFFSQHHLPHSLKISSTAFFEKWAAQDVMTDVFGRDAQLGGDIGLCFIDGNHEYDYVKSDFEATDRHLVVGGYILFDDSAALTGSKGVQRLIKELKANNTIGQRYELVMANPNHLLKKLS